MNGQSGSRARTESSTATQDFAHALLNDLTARRAPFPGWSRAAESLCRVMAQDGDDSQQLIALLTDHAELSMRVINMANAPLFGRSGRRLSELHLAVRRLGRDNVRAAIFGWALAQLRFAPRLALQHSEFSRLWSDSTTVAAIARLHMSRGGDSAAAQALLAGVLHNVGKYYLLARLSTADPGLNEPALRTELLDRWHALIGRELARSWQLPLAVCDAIGEQPSLAEQAAARIASAGGSPDSPVGNAAHATGLRDAVAIAVLAVGTTEPLAVTAAHLSQFAAPALEARDWQQLLERGVAESSTLRTLLGD